MQILRNFVLMLLELKNAELASQADRLTELLNNLENPTDSSATDNPTSTDPSDLSSIDSIFASLDSIGNDLDLDIAEIDTQNIIRDQIDTDQRAAAVHRK